MLHKTWFKVRGILFKTSVLLTTSFLISIECSHYFVIAILEFNHAHIMDSITNVKYLMAFWFYQHFHGIFV